MCIRDRVEPHTHYAVGEIAGQLGFYLPGIPALKLSLDAMAVSYTHLRAHETVLDLVCRLLLEKKKDN